MLQLVHSRYHIFEPLLQRLHGGLGADIIQLRLEILYEPAVASEELNVILFDNLSDRQSDNLSLDNWPFYDD